MKTYNTIYFLLFVLLIMGAFASMAQNSYGLRLLGFVAFAFGLLFLYQFVKYVMKKEAKDVFTELELVSLSILSFIYALNVFNIHSMVTEVIFVAAGLLLAGLYVRKLTMAYHKLKGVNRALSLLIVTFYLSILLFIIYIITGLFSPLVSKISGLAGFLVMIIFLISAVIKGNLLVEGENISAFKWIIDTKDRSGLLISLFSMMAVYLGLSSSGVLPPLYIDDLPQAYYDMARQSGTGIEKKIDGKDKHEQFKIEYDKFVSRNLADRK